MQNIYSVLIVIVFKLLNFINELLILYYLYTKSQPLFYTNLL